MRTGRMVRFGGCAMRTVVCTWNGDAFAPLGSFLDDCRSAYQAGERIALQEAEEPDHSLDKFRAAYMAQVNETWANLSEAAARRYTSPTKLRRWALIKAGWRTERHMVLDTEANAITAASFLMRLNDEAIIVQRRNVVAVYLARSQKLRRKHHDDDDDRMTREEFKQSADDVLAILRETIHVTKADLERAGKVAANG